LTTKKIYLFEYFSSEGAPHIGEIGNTLLLWGLLSILLLTLLSFAFSIQPRDQAEYLDSFLMGETLPSSTGNVPRQLYQPSLPGAIFALILFHQYVRSHIAEKRPSEGGSKLTIFLLARRRHYRIVSSFLIRICPGRCGIVLAKRKENS
jgi:hypothetical protein